ncbi:hypothetical protein Smic_86030 [Streptomyces microflavus]|uniref:Uncharacterized protein n=1 Tax=Streptomyces microflavus TaxID=1919 RepID=A0A7J0D7I4_STRMI|nr:hypothetical protein Smic_86030 [Streptomyces microflavus]
MSLIGDGLNKAVQKAFTRPVPRSAGAQMRYLVKQLGGTKAVAQMLRISQRTVERYVKNQIKKPRPDLAGRIDREVKARWQPQIRAKAKQKAASTGGIIIDTRARLGYTAPIGSTDQDRIRHLTIALPRSTPPASSTPKRPGPAMPGFRRSPPKPSRRSTSRMAAAAPAPWTRSASRTSSTSSSTCNRVRNGIRLGPGMSRSTIGATSADVLSPS